MVIDTSAVIAILFNEDDAETYEAAIDEASLRLISVASVLEATIVIEARFGEAAARDLDLLMHRLPIEIVDVDRDQLEWARIGFHRYGKGRHPAGLNFGDCFSYALAKARGQPLLYKGGDFSKTDLTRVV